MRHIIYVGQGTRDKDILFSFNGQTVKENQSLYFGEGWKKCGQRDTKSPKHRFLGWGASRDIDF